MSVPVIAELTYDPSCDGVNIVLKDEDLLNVGDVLRISRQNASYTALRAFLDDQGEVDETWLKEKFTESDMPAHAVGKTMSGVHPARSYDYDVISVFGDKYSGVNNFLRCLIWGWEGVSEDFQVLVLGTDDSVYGLRDNIPEAVVVGTLDDVQELWTYRDPENPCLLILDLRDASTQYTDADIKNIVNRVDPEEDPTSQVVIVGDTASTQNPTRFADISEMEAVFGVISDEAVEASGALGEVRQDNPTGVMWFRTMNPDETKTEWERVKTPILSKNATWDMFI